MAEIRPFRGIRYSPSAVGGLSDVLCPPYDVISPPEAETLRSRSDHNAVLLELPYERPADTPENNRYSRAAALFRRWLDEEALLREASQAMYLVDEEFAFEGRKRRREGLIAAVRLEEFEKRIVMPHEHTTPGPKADRLALMKAAHSNFSPIMWSARSPKVDVWVYLHVI